jgi:hypothetical protein
VTRLRAGRPRNRGSIRRGEEIFLHFQSVQKDRSPPSRLFIWEGVLTPGVYRTRCEAAHLDPFSAKVKNVRSCTSIPYVSIFIHGVCTACFTLLRSMTPFFNLRVLAYHTIRSSSSSSLSFLLLDYSRTVLFSDCCATFTKGRCQSVDCSLTGSAEIISSDLPVIIFR